MRGCGHVINAYKEYCTCLWLILASFAGVSKPNFENMDSDNTFVSDCYPDIDISMKLKNSLILHVRYYTKLWI